MSAAAPDDGAPERLGWRRVLGPLAAVGLALVLPPCVRVQWEGAAELERADAAAAEGDRAGEIVHLGRAARWRSPISRADDDALERLHALAAAADGQDDALALAVYDEIRTATIATGRDRAQLAGVDERIAVLRGAAERAHGSDVGGTGDPEAWHRARLAARVGPDPMRADGAALAFVVWIAATVAFVWRGLDAAGRVRPRPALIAFAVWLAAALTWAGLLVHAHA